MNYEEVTNYEDVVQLAEEDEEFFAALMADAEAALHALPNLGPEERNDVLAVIDRSVGANRKGAKTWLHGLLHSGVWRR